MLLEDYIANLQSLYQKHGNLPVTDKQGHEIGALLPVKVRFGESDVITLVDADTEASITGHSLCYCGDPSVEGVAHRSHECLRIGGQRGAIH